VQPATQREVEALGQSLTRGKTAENTEKQAKSLEKPAKNLPKTCQNLPLAQYRSDGKLGVKTMR
jgi:hypothetical protein